jgi:hypothetical protein
MRYARAPIKVRFEQKVSKGNECWEWTANKNNKGYGQIFFNKRLELAHRVSWILYIGEIPIGMCVLHRCDNPGCVNPAHLFLGTHTENMLDCKNKGRDHRASGETCARSKLTCSQVKTIKAMLQNGVRCSEIAKIFEVCRDTIADIKKGETRRNL